MTKPKKPKKQSGKSQTTKKATRKTVYEYVSIPPIVYVIMNYELTHTTEYQQQMNELLQPFVTKPGTINSFVAQREGHRYESFIQGSYDLNNNISSMDFGLDDIIHNSSLFFSII